MISTVEYAEHRATIPAEVGLECVFYQYIARRTLRLQDRVYVTVVAEGEEFRPARMWEHFPVSELLSYQMEAVRAGDAERASVIAKMGGSYLEGFRRARLAELVEENMPESERKARQKLAELEREREDLEVGIAMQRRARAGGAA